MNQRTKDWFARLQSPPVALLEIKDLSCIHVLRDYVDEVYLSLGVAVWGLDAPGTHQQRVSSEEQSEYSSAIRVESTALRNANGCDRCLTAMEE